LKTATEDAIGQLCNASLQTHDKLHPNANVGGATQNPAHASSQHATAATRDSRVAVIRRGAQRYDLRQK